MTIPVHSYKICEGVSALCEFLQKTVSALGSHIESLAHRICTKAKEIFDAIAGYASALVMPIAALFFGSKHIVVQEVHIEKEQALVQKEIAALEKEAVYPLGTEDSFKIDHGADYFAFFKRLGELHYFTARDNTTSQKQITAVGAAVLRDVSFKQGDPLKKTWYLCDLKVRPEYRGKHLPMHLFRNAAHYYFRCPRGYAVSMNPASGQNRIEKLFRKFSWLPLSKPQQLSIFSLGKVEMFTHRPLLEKYRGPISYITLKGKKDLILQSTKSPMPLLHAQWGPAKEGDALYTEEQDGHTHMFCVPENDALHALLLARSLKPAATATIISHGMEGADWAFIQTSDI